MFYTISQHWVVGIEIKVFAIESCAQEGPELPMTMFLFLFLMVPGLKVDIEHTKYMFYHRVYTTSPSDFDFLK